MLADNDRMTVRVNPEIRHSIRVAADRDGSPLAIIVRRALRLGLLEIARRDQDAMTQGKVATE